MQVWVRMAVRALVRWLESPGAVPAMPDEKFRLETKTNEVYTVTSPIRAAVQYGQNHCFCLSITAEDP